MALERHQDERGFFARSFCQEEFTRHGINATVAQANVAYNHRAGTLRGLHYRVPPAGETKVVRCTRGAIYDVIVDLRPESPTYMEHVGIELDADSGNALYVPEMVAHGYLSLVDGTEVSYLMGAPYEPGYERGIRYDDVAFAIAWPREVEILNVKDRSWPPFDPRV